MNRYVIIALFTALGFITYQSQRISTLLHDNEKLTFIIEEADDKVKQYEAERITIAEIDAKHTEELNNAQNEIDHLNAAVAAGAARLHVNAKCEEPKQAESTSVVDGQTARLTDTAERNYFVLRQRIVKNEQQILGLQDYINKVCLVN